VEVKELGGKDFALVRAAWMAKCKEEWTTKDTKYDEGNSIKSYC
jgi:hypothetical protein